MVAAAPEDTADVLGDRTENRGWGRADCAEHQQKQHSGDGDGDGGDNAAKVGFGDQTPSPVHWLRVEWGEPPAAER